MRTVVVPTLNEEENIAALVHDIFRHMGLIGTKVIIVDDNSTDRTQHVVRTLMEEYSNLHMIIRAHERSLASAVREGAGFVCSGPVAIMDADFSHDPKYLPLLFDRLGEGYDIVVGSRYTENGKVIGWSIGRLVISRCATALTRFLFRVNILDPMSGFVVCRSSKALTRSIEYADFKFLLETLVRNRGLRVTEIPITFRDRVHGRSKLRITGVIRFLLFTGRLLFVSYLKAPSK